MTTAITIFDAEQFEVTQRIAKAMVASGYFADARDIAQAIVKIMAGQELGLPPFASMSGIHIIKGKPTLGATPMATLVKNHPDYNYRVLEINNSACRIQFYENGEKCGISEFSIQDAQKAGTQNMGKFPRNMLFARAISNGVKWFAPGVFGGAPVYVPEELGATVDEEGDIIIDVTPEPKTLVNGVVEYTVEETDDQQEMEPEIIEAQVEEIQKKDAPPWEGSDEFVDKAETIVEKPKPERLTDAETVIVETPAIDFWKATVALIDRYENVYAAQNAAKKLGITSIPSRKSKNHPDPTTERVEIYRTLAAHAVEMDETEKS